VEDRKEGVRMDAGRKKEVEREKEAEKERVEKDRYIYSRNDI
jgi:hypothetical protein